MPQTIMHRTSKGFAYEHGRLTPIADSSRSLSTFNAEPAQVLFTHDGSKLLVTEYTSNCISVFNVNQNGTVTESIVNDSYGDGPLGPIFYPLESS